MLKMTPLTKLVALSLSLILFSSCERKQQITKSVSIDNQEEKAKKKDLTRSIRFYGTDDDFGVVLGDQEAFLHQSAVSPQQIDISHDIALSLLEDFYAIPSIEEFRGKPSDNRQTSIQYLIQIYDEMPQYYSEDWVDYVIPKDQVALHPKLDKWFQQMHTLREQTNAKQQAVSSTPNQ
jgi:hypothetical protein